MVSDNKQMEFEGVSLKDVTPKLEKSWIRYPYILKLNFLLTGSLLTQITSGFDSSMLNGLQSLTDLE